MPNLCDKGGSVVRDQSSSDAEYWKSLSAVRGSLSDNNVFAYYPDIESQFYYPTNTPSTLNKFYARDKIMMFYANIQCPAIQSNPSLSSETNNGNVLKKLLLAGKENKENSRQHIIKSTEVSPSISPSSSISQMVCRNGSQNGLNGLLNYDPSLGSAFHQSNLFGHRWSPPVLTATPQGRAYVIAPTPVAQIQPYPEPDYSKYHPDFLWQLNTYRRGHVWSPII